jgi:hypothetical protein
MINPVKDSELAEQIEIARQSIERWPEWLKDAVGISGEEPVDLASAQKALTCTSRLSAADFID